MNFLQIIYDPKQLNARIVMERTDVAKRLYHGSNIIESVNLALQEAVASNLPWIALIESDMHFEESGRSDLNELMSVDPMIGFIALQNSFSSGNPGRDWEYSVLGNSKVLIMKMSILADLGALDGSFRTVSFANLDLILRANQFGYRCVTASSNFPQATRPSFSRNDWKHLRKKHPRLMGWLRREKQNKKQKQHIKPRSDSPMRIMHQPVRSVEFDLTNLRPHHNGTAEVACKIVKNFKERFGAEFEVRLHAPETILSFHKLEYSKPSQEPSDCSLRFGQFQTPKEILLFMQRAPLLGAVFLDTIALDCMHLDEVNLSKLWGDSFMSLDFVLFISEFSRRQALLRFPDLVPELSVAQLLSTSTAEYRHSQPKDIACSDYFFIVGNRFAHKDVHYIVEKIASLSNKKVIALADKADRSHNISYLPSGSMSSHEMEELYANAAVVIYPSHYEGFGFPIMHALANRRPVICRDLPVYHEIIEKTAEGINVYPCRSRSDLIRLAVEKTPVWLEPTQKVSPVTWLDSADNLAKTIRRASDHRRDEYVKKHISESIVSEYPSLRLAKRPYRIMQSARKRMDALIAPYANLLGYL